MIRAIRWAREQQVPYLGLCLGLQCAVIEFARMALGTEDANSSEFNVFTEHPVIDLMPDQTDVTEKGGTMRLGLYPARLEDEHARFARLTGPRSSTSGIAIDSRSTTRTASALGQAGMACSGVSPDDRLVEFIELRDHPWFAATQAHPELKSRPNRPASAVPRLRGRGGRPARPPGCCR